jgi:hypothetical protein
MTPNSLLQLWLTRIKKDRHLTACLARWGVNRQQIAAFIAGNKELPYASLLTISADTGISCDTLLREFGTAALLEVPDLAKEEFPREYPFHLGLIATRSMRPLYHHRARGNRLSLYARDAVDHGVSGAVCVGVRLEKILAVEWCPDPEVFHSGAVSRVRRGAHWLWVDWCSQSPISIARHQYLGEVATGWGGHGERRR